MLEGSYVFGRIEVNLMVQTPMRTSYSDFLFGKLVIQGELLHIICEVMLK